MFQMPEVIPWEWWHDALCEAGVLQWLGDDFDGEWHVCSDAGPVGIGDTAEMYLETEDDPTLSRFAAWHDPSEWRAKASDHIAVLEAGEGEPSMGDSMPYDAATATGMYDAW